MGSSRVVRWRRTPPPTARPGPGGTAECERPPSRATRSTDGGEQQGREREPGGEREPAEYEKGRGPAAQRGAVAVDHLELRAWLDAEACEPVQPSHECERSLVDVQPPVAGRWHRPEPHYRAPERG